MVAAFSILRTNRMYSPHGDHCDLYSFEDESVFKDSLNILQVITPQISYIFTCLSPNCFAERLFLQIYSLGGTLVANLVTTKR